MTGLELNDLNPDDGTIFIRDGKYSKDRVVPCGEWAWEIIEEYLQDERPWKIENPDEQTVFVNKYGNGFSKQGLLMMVKRHAKKAGIKKEMTVHSIRHAFATHMVDNGCDIRAMQEILGHSSPSTTAIYISVSARRLKEAHTKFHPMEKDDEIEDVA